jgi:hypothetical protein
LALPDTRSKTLYSAFLMRALARLLQLV